MFKAASKAQQNCYTHTSNNLKHIMMSFATLEANKVLDKSFVIENVHSSLESTDQSLIVWNRLKLTELLRHEIKEITLRKSYGSKYLEFAQDNELKIILLFLTITKLIGPVTYV